MATADKQILIKNLENELSDLLSAKTLSQTLATVSQVLNGYAVERLNGDAVKNTSLDLINAFLDAKKLEGCSDKTVYHYRRKIIRMIESVNVPADEITVYHLRSHLMSERERGISERTLAGDRHTYSSFFGWLHKEKMIQENPCLNLGSIKYTKKVLFPFSSVEIERIKEVCHTDRDKAMVSFLLSTGCRVSEVVSLDYEDIDFQEMEVKVLGKGNKERIVFIDDITAMLLKRYKKNRKPEIEALFAGRGTERMTTGGVRFALKKIEQESGAENVHPHRFRRTLATNLIDRGMQIQEVAAILGHDNINTTMTYIKVDKRNVKNAYMKYA